MSTPVVIGGLTYYVPAVGENNWGQNVSDLLIAISGSLSPAGFFTIVSVSTSPITCVSGRTYLVDTSSARTLNLPTPASGAYILVRDTTGSSATYNITLHRGSGEKIDGSAADKTLATAYGQWWIVSDGTDWFTLLNAPAPIASPTFTGNVTFPGTGIWNSSGNVGIGTASPTDKLHIVGTQKLTSHFYRASGTETRLYDFSSSNLNAYSIASDATGATQNVYLQLVGSGYHSTLYGIADPASWQFLRFGDTGIEGAGIVQFANKPLAFFTNQLERMRINAAGTIGIGTTSTGAALHIAQSNMAMNSEGNLFLQTTDALAADTGGMLVFGGIYNSSAGTAYYSNIVGRKENATDGNYAGYLAFATRASGGSVATERMRITSAGATGIGKTPTSATAGDLEVLRQIYAGAYGNVRYATTVTALTNYDFVMDSIMGIVAVYQQGAGNTKHQVYLGLFAKDYDSGTLEEIKNSGESYFTVSKVDASAFASYIRVTTTSGSTEQMTVVTIPFYY